MTVLNGKTIGSIFMAGLVDHLSKEANMTPKQFFELDERVIKDIGFWKRGFSAIGGDGKVTISNYGPCYGECGMGERFRAQWTPKKLKELEYAHALMVSKHFFTPLNTSLVVLRHLITTCNVSVGN